MLISRIAPNYLNQSNTNHLKKQYKQSSNAVVSYDAFCKTSFCGLQPNSIASALKRKRGSLAKKTYQVLTDKNELYINVSNDSKLGKEPIICYSYSDENKTIHPNYSEMYGIDKNYKAKWLDYVDEMDKDDNGYKYWPIYSNVREKLNYSIYYQDTKKWDDNHGKGYEIKPLAIVKKAILFDNKERNQPLFRIIRRGSTKGKVIVNDTLSELLRTLPKSNEPVIAVVGDFAKMGVDGDLYGDFPKNIKSVIITKNVSSILDHEIAFVRPLVANYAVLYDEKKIKALQKMAGNFIGMDVSQQGLRWRHIKTATLEPQNVIRPEIKIPEIVTSDRLLKSEEYTPELVGSKAYNLRRLEEMKNKEKLKDVKIPRSFAIPCGVFDRTLAANPEIAIDIEKRIQEINGMTDTYVIAKGLGEIRDLIRYSSVDKFAPENLKVPEEIQKEITNFKDRLGLSSSVMVRSSFNGEDAKSYSAAGLYDSYLYVDKESGFKTLSDTIKLVWRSKWNNRAYLSRRGNNIDHALIKPTVIIQDFVDADYRFTIYTKDPESTNGNKLLIQMRSKKSLDPYIIKYDKDKKEIEIEQVARKARKITLDDKFRIISADSMDDPIVNNLEQYKPLLKKVCKAAEEIEKEFGTAQDIEGGIKLGADDKVDASQIYIWQTRDQIF